MDLQLITSIFLGAIAALYIILYFKRQLNHIEIQSKCEDCPLPNEQFVDNKKD